MATAVISADDGEAAPGPDSLTLSVQNERRQSRKQFVLPPTLDKSATQFAKGLDSNLNETVIVALAYFIDHQPEEALALLKKVKESKMQRLRTGRARTTDAQLSLAADPIHPTETATKT